jgi:hypothetical protein
VTAALRVHDIMSEFVINSVLFFVSFDVSIDYVQSTRIIDRLITF